ncbi:MAG: hypothetical protein JXB26_02900 [Candidatus Aminicenantes bacterium]|nr:hypothetical protein [Candidatus Aminicenantes bacterium]
MKKFYRCHVCNDIHYGVKPPEICPTCSAKNAYVETNSDEAIKICSYTTKSINKQEFLKAIEALSENKEFQVNPDKEKVSMLIEGIFQNEKNHGLKYCPCRLSSKDPKKDLMLVCPCRFFIHETYKNKPDGECWCGLFIRRKENG